MSEEQKQQKDHSQSKETKGFKMNMPTAVVIAGMLIAGALALPKIVPVDSQAASVKSVDSQVASAEVEGKVLIHPVDENDYVKGAKNPKITLVEFSDFGCGFCGRFHPVLEQILEEHPEDVAWAYRQLPYRHVEASRGAECVGEHLGNEAFWSFTNTLFDNQNSIDNTLMEKVSGDLGLDSETFSECLESEEIAKRVDRDFTEATLIGVQGTPHTVVVTETGREFSLRGALGYDQLKTIVESLVEEEL